RTLSVAGIARGGPRPRGTVTGHPAPRAWPSGLVIICDTGALGYLVRMPDMPRTLTAALHQEEDWYVAQCLEVDVASQGHTIGEALPTRAGGVDLSREGGDAPAGHAAAPPLVTSSRLPAA